MLKHSASDYRSRLPEIRQIQAAKVMRRPMLEPASESNQGQMPSTSAYKIRNANQPPQSAIQTLRPSRRSTMNSTSGVNPIKSSASQPRLNLANINFASKPSSITRTTTNACATGRLNNLRNQASLDALKSAAEKPAEQTGTTGFRLRTLN